MRTLMRYFLGIIASFSLSGSFSPLFSQPFVARPEPAATVTVSLNDGDTLLEIVLEEIRYPVTNLVVDPKTLVATWDKPLVTAVREDFEGAEFPPPGWQSIPVIGGWFRTDDESTIPPWDSYYACANEELVPDARGCCDLLITPACDLRADSGYIFTFDSFYTGMFGQLAMVEYSLDGGNTWEILYQLSPNEDWTEITIDISLFQGENGPEAVWFAFYFIDAGQWNSGWAIDNVRIIVPEPPANYIDYFVYLDDTLQGSTILESWDYSPLTYGQAYTASVAARYASGLSEKAYFTFESLYLYPPRNLMDTIQGGFCLSWEAPMMYPALAGSPDGPTLRLSGNARAWAYDVEDNISVTFTLNQPGVLNPLGGPAPGVVSGADIVDGIYYCHAYGGTWMTMDTATGAFTVIGPCLDMTGIAYDFTSGQMYGVTMDGGLYQVDPASGATTFIGADSAVYMDVACDNDGNLYGFDIGADVFGSIDKATGAFTAIAPFPFDGGFPQGAGTDHSSNTVYHAAFNASIGAGQLFIADQVTGSYTFVGNFGGNAILDGFAVGASPDSLGGVTPEGLLGYNVYRNGGYIDYIEAPETTWCPDEGIPPGFHSYTVTAVYDLASYGFPGETDESMEAGPVFDTVEYCMDLEFFEGWDQVSFDTNNWSPEGAHWLINTEEGNPAPSAEFAWDPIDTNYSYSLESYPICGLGVVEGNIWLDFDLILESFNETGTEKMLVQLWDWESQVWNTVATYDNAQGSFGWSREHINISPYTENKIFKVRFTGTGTNSLNILAWNLDNIHVYRDCQPPTDLWVSFWPPGFMLYWSSPIEGPKRMHWDDGPNYTSKATNGTRGLTGYNIWRRENDGEYENIGFTVDTTYLDLGPFSIGNIYVYKVQAIYYDEVSGDSCDAFSNEDGWWESVFEPEGISRISLSPNPAADIVSISSSHQIVRVKIYSAHGQCLFDQYAGSDHIELDVSGFEEGIYLLKAWQKEGVQTRKLIIMR